MRKLPLIASAALCLVAPVLGQQQETRSPIIP